MAASNVLIVGLQGLGVEIGKPAKQRGLRNYLIRHTHTAKNIVLAGVKSVTIYDPEPVTLQDLSSQASRIFTSSQLYLNLGHCSSSSVKRTSASHEPRPLSPASLSSTPMFLYGTWGGTQGSRLMLT